MNLKTELLLHQKEAFDKLKDIKAFALFMDMGTGKTRTTLEFIKYREHKITKVIWITPCSTKYNLKSDIEKHSDADVGIIEDKEEHFITICGIETISMSDKIYLKINKLIEDNPNCFIVIDESHTIKNPHSKRFNRVKDWTSKSKYRTILTGTPITKNTEDLYTQFYFLHPKILGYNSYRQFAKIHLVYSEKYPGMIVEYLNVDFINRRIYPYIFQKKKEECLDLPKRVFTRRHFYVNSKTQDAYDLVKEAIFSQDIEEFDGTVLFNLFLYLARVSSGCFPQFGEIRGLLPEYLPEEYCFEDNCRAEFLQEVLEEFKEHKIIVYYRFNADAENIQKNIKNKCYVINGSVKPKVRNDIIKEFEKDTSDAILLINQKSGAYGLNLQFANCLIFYDGDFNFSERKQAEDRIYRIGQEKQTFIVSMISNLSIDERIQDNIDCKGATLNNLIKEIKNAKNNKDRLKKIREKIKNML